MGEIEAAFSSIVPISAEHDLIGFDCGVSSLDQWLVDHALRNDGNLASRTYVVERGGRVVGYYAISVTYLLHDEVIGSVRRNMPVSIPGILIGRLAVDRSVHRNGVGLGLLQDATRRAESISEMVGARAIVVEAISEEARQYYLRFGFTETRDNPMKLYIDIRAMQRARATSS